MKNKKLTNKKYWNNNWKKISFPQNICVENSPQAIQELDCLFKKFLPPTKKEILEIGCAPGTWLDYFYKTFNYKIHGIEYTEVGYQNTLKNLKILGTPAHIIKGDLFTHKFIKKFDIVFSMGLIEHFDNPLLVIKKHLTLLKKDGYLIIEIPNLTNLNKILLTKDQLTKHNTNIMNLSFFNSAIKSLKLKKLYLDYVGKFNPYLFPCKNNRYDYCKNIFLNVLSNILPLPKSKYYSPYILLIAKKQLNPKNEK